MFNMGLYQQALEKVGKRYLLVNLTAMRMRQLVNGADPLVDPEGLDLMDIVLTEIIEEMISIQAPEPTEEDVFA